MPSGTAACPGRRQAQGVARADGGGGAFEPARQSPRPDTVAPSRCVSRVPEPPAPPPTFSGQPGGHSFCRSPEAPSTCVSFRTRGTRMETGVKGTPTGAKRARCPPGRELCRRGAHLSCSCGTPARSRCGTSSHRCRSGTCTHCPPGDRGAPSGEGQEAAPPRNSPPDLPLATSKCVRSVSPSPSRPRSLPPP